MSAVPTLLADAVTSVLNTAQQADEFGTLEFTVRRSYPDWDDDFKDLKTLAVDVVYVSSGASGGEVVELDSVSTLDHDSAIDVAIRKRFEATDRESNGRLKNSSVDALVTLVEQIHESLASDRNTEITLASGIYANWLDAQVRTYCDYKRLREGVFLGVVRVKFNVSKTVP